MKLKKNKIDRPETIVFGKPGNYVIKDEFTRLKDNILYFAVDGKCKVIQIESAIAGEAKTTTVSNLAVCLGENGKKVCLIDLDFRKARVHRLFNIENINGLADYMIDKVSKKEMIKKTEYENVDIINRGSEINNAAVILTSEKLKKLICELKEEYDFILLDCPPVLLISDFIHISNLSDGILFVTAYGRTKKKQVLDAISQIKKNNIPIIGATLTCFDPNKSSNYSEYKYYNHYTYQEKENND